jgi:flagellar secretion chaperone FliS
MDPRIAYREADARGATSLRLVVLLYEQLMQDLRQASRAIEQSNIELRSNRINHALDVACLLQATLNMEKGGKVARDLAHFYEVFRSRLCDAQMQSSKEILAGLITDVLTVREAWSEVERVETGAAVKHPSARRADDGAAPRPRQLAEAGGRR